MSQGMLKKPNNLDKFEMGTPKTVLRSALSTLASTTDIYLPK